MVYTVSQNAKLETWGPFGETSFLGITHILYSAGAEFTHYFQIMPGPAGSTRWMMGDVQQQGVAPVNKLERERETEREKRR